MANFTGTSASETFIGTEANDTAIGNGGDDSLVGNGGDDTLRLGANGASVADGGAGNDILIADVGGSGVKNLAGGDGDDHLYVGGNVSAYGLYGGDGFDTLHLLGSTTLDLTTANILMMEHFVGSTSADTISLDLYQLSHFSSFDGGSGSDTVKLSFWGSRTIADQTPSTLVNLTSVETLQIFGSTGDDTLDVSIEQFTRVDAFYLGGGTDNLHVVTSGDVDLTTRFPTLSGVEALTLTGDGSVRMNVSQFSKFAIIGSNLEVTLADTGARLALLTPAQIASMSAPPESGLPPYVDVLDATNDLLSLTVAQFRALGPVALTAGDVVTLADTGANLATLTTAELIAAGASGVDKIDATNNVLSLTVEQYRALVGEIGLTAKDVITLADTGENLADLSLAEISALTSNFIDKLDATDGELTLSLQKIQALDKVALTSGDVVTATATGAEFAALTTTDIRLLGTKGVDFFDATDDAVFFTKNQYLALVTIKVVSADEVVLRDSGGQLIALTPAQFAGLADRGFDRIDSTTDALTLSAAQYGALGTVVLTAGDVVLLRDTGAAIGSLSVAEFQELVAKGIDKIDATDNVLTVNVAKVAGLLPGMLTTSDVVTLSDTGTAIGAMSVADIAGLAAKFIDKIDSVNGVLSLTVAQYQALGSVTLTADDTITLADTGANLAALSGSQLAALAGKGIDRIDATDNALSLTLAKLQALGTVALVAADVVTLADTATVLNALTPAEISALAGRGVDRIDSLNNTLTWSVAQALALGTVTLTAADSVTVVGTGAEIAALTSAQISTFAARGVDRLDASDDALTLTRAQYLALGTMTVAAADVVVLADTSGALLGLTPAQFGAMAAAGIDRIDATDNVVIMNAAQYLGLGSVALTAGDAVTLRDTGANIAALSPTTFAGLAAKGVDKIDANDNALALTVAQLDGIAAGMLTASDVVTLADTSTVLNALTPAEIAALAGKGIDQINATDDVLILSLAQYRALGTVALTQADFVTLADTSANIATLTPAENAALTAKGIDEVQSTGGTTVETALATFKLDDGVDNLTFIGEGAFTGSGNEIANTITGGASGDTLSGLGGNDTLVGLDGDDFLIGGLGADVLNGGAGGDYASYRNATAALTVSLADPSANTGEAIGDSFIGIERLEGSAFNDTLIGDAADNTLRGGLGADTLNGGAGRDTASYASASAGLTVSLTTPGSNSGEASGDTFVSIENISGSAFDDNLTGDAGDNTFFGNGGADKMDGGAGFDYASYRNAAAAVTAYLADTVHNTGEAQGDSYISIEGLSGSNFDDTLVGDASNNWLEGGLGFDILNGGAGVDYAAYFNASSGVRASLLDPWNNTGEAVDAYTSIEGLGGSRFDDILIGDGLDNYLRGGLGADYMDAGNGFDFAEYYNAATGVTASLANSSVNTGEAAGDTYVSIEGLSGSLFNDILIGNSGDNWLIGLAGADYLDGGLGNNDFAAYSNATAAVQASLANPGTNTGDAAGDTYVSIESLSGTSFNDILIGDSGNNTLRGRLGADQLNGGDGFDVAEYLNSTIGLTVTLDTTLAISNTGEAVGDTFNSIEGLSGSNFSDTLVGDSGNNTLFGRSGGDILFGGAGNDTFYGNSATAGLDGSVDRVDYSRVTGLSQGISVNWLAGSVVGQAGIIDTDSMFQIEAVFGTAFVDTFDATGFTNTSARAGDFGGYQFIQGGGGNDIVIGNNNTEVFYGDATSGVTVNLSISGGVYGGTATGGGVGTDQLTNVNRFVGSNFNDTFFGTNNVEIFDGYNGGDDVYHGGGGLDIVEFDGSSRDAIDVNLAAGTITGRAAGSNIGNDTLDSIERIRGSEFADRYDATGFSGSSTNAGSSGTFNRFEGQGGADEVIGNGNTYLDYFNTSAAVTVTTTGQGVGTATATYGSNTATDTFSGVAAVNGGNSNDTFNGGIGADLFFGQGGNDFMNGGAGDDTLEGGSGADSLSGGAGFDYAQYRNAGAAVSLILASGGFAGDALGDHFTSIEGAIGTNFNDTLTGSSVGNILVGGFGADTLNGGAGDHATLFESADLADYASYVYSQSGLTVSLVNPSSNTGEAFGDTFTNINGLIGSGFNDVLTGSDLYYGDYFIGGYGNDIIDGRMGFDTARYDTGAGVGIFINMGTGIVQGGAGQDTLISIEGVWGSSGADTYDASGYNAGTPAVNFDDQNLFEGFGGADNIIGSSTQAGLMTATTISYAHATAGITVNMSGTTSGTVIATYGADTSIDTFSNVNDIDGSEFADTFNGVAGDQSFYGGGGGDTMSGGAGYDALIGGAGDDFLYGGANDDFLMGEAGADVLDGGDGIDMATYVGNANGVTASLENSAINTGDAAGDTYISIENLTGSYGSDVLIGNSGNNVIDGSFGGGDVYNGRGGMDTFSGSGYGGQGDTFVFDSAIGPGNLATIFTYSHGEDHFNLDNAIFTQLGAAGALGADTFVNGAAALDVNDRILFDSATGNVSYDADGSGGGAAVVFAKIQNLQGGPLDHTDFLIV